MKHKLTITITVMGMLLLLWAMPVAAQSYTTYVTQTGDTLAKIALKFCTTWQEIYNINRQTIGDDPNLLFSGKSLTIPNRCTGGSNSGTTKPPTASGVYDRGARTYATGTLNGNVYTVAWGDTAFTIGQRFGLTSDAIAKANGMADANKIFAGQKLVVPGLSGIAVTLPIQPIVPSSQPAQATRAFAFGECTIQFNSATNIWNTPNGSVIANIEGPSTSPAVRISRINNALWYQIEYLETNPWVPASIVGTIGKCGL